MKQQRATAGATDAGVANSRINLLLARAAADECEVVAFNSETGEGYLYSGGVFLRDKANKPPLTDSQLRGLARYNTNITYTCVPKGNGRRLALDRYLDGVLNAIGMTNE
jgi:hypothetical protein